MRAPHLSLRGKADQRGAALMIMLVVMVAGVASIMVGGLSISALNNARQEKTSAALVQAKDALIGKSITYDDYPGSLPCPDTDNDGESDAGGASECPIYIGRLPWKTLGLPELRDGAGEQLWYTLSRNFRRYDLVRPLNSNTQGTLNITGTVTAGNVIAIVFSPGSALSGQNRSAAQTANCTTTGTTIAASLCATNYLEGSNKNLSSAATPNTDYQGAVASNTFNDQLFLITTKNLMPLVEQRVAGVLKKALDDYFVASDIIPGNRYYPWADSIGASATYAADDGVNRGWLPDNASAGGTPNWVSASPPQWFLDNQWYTLIHYSVAEFYTADHDPGTLTVDGTGGVRVLFFMPGTPIPANIAPATVRAIDNLSHYLETRPGPIQNNDNADDSFVTPTSQDRDRDRLYWLSSSSTWKP